MRFPGHGKKSIRVILDTNVLISAILFRKALRPITELISRGDITVCFITTTFTELQTVLDYPKFQKRLEATKLTPADIMAWVGEHSVIVSDPVVIPRLTPDLPDNYIIAAAVAANAKHIVTGDRQLLELGRIGEINIITPRQLLDRF